ncbi:MAG: hypothetical protein ACN4GZ_01295 [Acidimicrobiales bacterium]
MSEEEDNGLVDELPDDVAATERDLEDYIFPNNNRRKIPGYLYLVCAVGFVGFYVVYGDDGVLVNVGYLWAAAIAVVVGVYSILAGWNLNVDERDALVVAASEVGQPIGPASAQLSWRGLLSRPVWRILCYSAEDPPLTRALVIVDGVDGHIVERIIEDNPEDWQEVKDSAK